MGSSDHVFFSSLIQFNRNSMWSLDFPPPPPPFTSLGCEMPWWSTDKRTPPPVFTLKAAHRDEYAFTESQHSSLDLFCRETPLRSVCSSALMGPSGRTDWSGGFDRKSDFDIVREPVACLGRHGLYSCEVVFADFNQEHFAGDAANNQFPVLVCGSSLSESRIPACQFCRGSFFLDLHSFGLSSVADFRVATCTVTDSSMSEPFAAHCAVSLNSTCTIVRFFGHSCQE